MKKALMCATAAAAFASAGMVAQAEEGWYGRADATYAFDGRLDHDPVTQDVVGSMGGSSDLEESWGGDIGLGYGFDNGFRIEGVLGYSAGDLSVPANVNGVVPGAVSNADGYLQSTDLMLNGIYDFNRAGAFQPYVGLGIGAIRAKAKGSNLALATGTDLTAINGFSGTDTSLAYQGLLGFGYKLSEKLTMDVGYKYFVAEDMDLDGVHGYTNYEGDLTKHSA
ncbi:outer membrane beta-barrel protein, partial [Hyphomonas sp.]|uniref:outer membrane protein n=1 Tax=Hyphomonas sp. TaxID=87 RepID=UPI0030F90804